MVWLLLSCGDQIVLFRYLQAAFGLHDTQAYFMYSMRPANKLAAFFLIECNVKL
jgi:hypothetical protein